MNDFVFVAFYSVFFLNVRLAQKLNGKSYLNRPTSTRPPCMFWRNPTPRTDQSIMVVMNPRFHYGNDGTPSLFLRSFARSLSVALALRGSNMGASSRPRSARHRPTTDLTVSSLSLYIYIPLYLSLYVSLPLSPYLSLSIKLHSVCSLF